MSKRSSKREVVDRDDETDEVVKRAPKKEGLNYTAIAIMLLFVIPAAITFGMGVRTLEIFHYVLLLVLIGNFSNWFAIYSTQ